MSRREIVWEIRLTLHDGPHADHLTAAWTQLDALPGYSPDRLETEAQLHIFLARLCWRDADRARDRERRIRARIRSPDPG